MDVVTFGDLADASEQPTGNQWPLTFGDLPER